jgi:hypothetical protein
VIVPHPFVTLSLDEVKAVAEAKASEIFGHLAVQMASGLTATADAEAAR